MELKPTASERADVTHSQLATIAGADSIANREGYDRRFPLAQTGGRVVGVPTPAASSGAAFFWGGRGTAGAVAVRLPRARGTRW